MTMTSLSQSRTLRSSDKSYSLSKNGANLSEEEEAGMSVCKPCLTLSRFRINQKAEGKSNEL